MDDASSPAHPAFRLYSPAQIGLASFIGAPVAACWFLSRNYRRLGQPRQALWCLLWGVLGTAALLVVVEWVPLPERFPNLAIPLAYSVGLRQTALALHGAAVERHLAAGGRLGSWGVVVGLSLLFLIGLFLLIFGTVFFLPED